MDVLIDTCIIVFAWYMLSYAVRSFLARYILLSLVRTANMLPICVDLPVFIREATRNGQTMNAFLRGSIRDYRRPSSSYPSGRGDERVYRVGVYETAYMLVDEEGCWVAVTDIKKAMILKPPRMPMLRLDRRTESLGPRDSIMILGKLSLVPNGSPFHGAIAAIEPRIITSMTREHLYLALKMRFAQESIVQKITFATILFVCAVSYLVWKNILDY